MAKLRISRERPAVVGIVHDAESLAGIKDGLVTAEICDVLEFRLDALVPQGPVGTLDLGQEGSLARQVGVAGHTGLPLLLTARSPLEGGLNQLTAATRAALLRAFLEDCEAIDVEVSSFGQSDMEPVIDQALGVGKLLVASFHDFEKTPERPILLEAIESARRRGAGVAKIAARLHGPADACVLLELLADDLGIALSVMGMGPLGGASRLLLAECGSVLNYGHLGSGNAPGQWHAGDLRRHLRGKECPQEG